MGLQAEYDPQTKANSPKSRTKPPLTQHGIFNPLHGRLIHDNVTAVPLVHPCEEAMLHNQSHFLGDSDIMNSENWKHRTSEQT